MENRWGVLIDDGPAPDGSDKLAAAYALKIASGVSSLVCEIFDRLAVGAGLARGNAVKSPVEGSMYPVPSPKGFNMSLGDAILTNLDPLPLPLPALGINWVSSNPKSSNVESRLPCEDESSKYAALSPGLANGDDDVPHVSGMAALEAYDPRDLAGGLSSWIGETKEALEYMVDSPRRLDGGGPRTALLLGGAGGLAMAATGKSGIVPTDVPTDEVVHLDESSGGDMASYPSIDSCGLPGKLERETKKGIGSRVWDGSNVGGTRIGRGGGLLGSG